MNEVVTMDKDEVAIEAIGEKLKKTLGICVFDNRDDGIPRPISQSCIAVIHRHSDPNSKANFEITAVGDCDLEKINATLPSTAYPMILKKSDENG